MATTSSADGVAWDLRDLYAAPSAPVISDALNAAAARCGRASYVALLEAGGSQSPAAMLAALGVDARDPAFWQRGLNELRRLVARAEELVEG